MSKSTSNRNNALCNNSVRKFTWCDNFDIFWWFALIPLPFYNISMQSIRYVTIFSYFYVFNYSNEDEIYYILKIILWIFKQQIFFPTYIYLGRCSYLMMFQLSLHWWSTDLYISLFEASRLIISNKLMFSSLLLSPNLFILSCLLFPFRQHVMPPSWWPVSYQRRANKHSLPEQVALVFSE